MLFSRALSPSTGGEPAVVVLQKLLAGFREPRAGIRQTEPKRWWDFNGFSHDDILHTFNHHHYPNLITLLYSFFAVFSLTIALLLAAGLNPCLQSNNWTMIVVQLLKFHLFKVLIILKYVYDHRYYPKLRISLFPFLNVFTYISSHRWSLCFVSVLQGPAAGPHWPLTGIRGWRLTLARGCKLQQFRRKVATAALIGWLPTCWCSVTPDTTGDNIDRKTVSGWADFINTTVQIWSLHH